MRYKKIKLLLFWLVMLDVMLVICTKMESENELLLCIHKSTFVRTLNMYFYFADLLKFSILGLT